MCNVLGPMAQDIPMQEQISPQMDPKPEMGAAAAEAAVHDTSPPPLSQNPPTLAESAQPVTVDMAQVCAMLAGVTAAMQKMQEGMENIMDGNARQMEGKMEANLKKNAKQMKEETKGMREEMKEMRGEMQNMGAGLQDGLEQLKIGNGERRRATCWATEEWGRVEVTEEVTVTETYTREIRHVEVTELVSW